MKEPSKEKIKKIEKLLRADIRWAIKHGPGWDPYHGAIWSSKKWGPVSCNGLCAIGAYVAHRQPKRRPKDDDVSAFARIQEVDYLWAENLYLAVADDQDENCCDSSKELASRLRAYAQEIKAP